MPASVGSSAAPSEYLEGGTEQKFPFPFLNFFQNARKTEDCKGNFCEVAAEAKRRRAAGRRAYDSGSPRHALRAWHITDFENRCERSCINTPSWESSLRRIKARVPGSLASEARVPRRRCSSWRNFSCKILKYEYDRG